MERRGMDQFGDVLGEPRAPGQQVQRVQSEVPPARLPVLILDNRPLLADMLVEALRRTAPDLVVRSVASVEAVDAGTPAVVLYSFLGRVYDETTQDLVLARLRAALPGLPLVIVADEADTPGSERLAPHGLSAWLSSVEDLPALAGAVRAAVLAGPGPQPRATSHSAGRIPEQARRPDAMPGISARERSILELVHRGRPNKLIAHELGISESTVKVHLRNLMAKLRVRNRTQLALMWRRYEREAPAGDPPRKGSLQPGSL